MDNSHTGPDLAAVRAALDGMVPYCDVLEAHLRDVVEHNGTAVQRLFTGLATIEHLAAQAETETGRVSAGPRGAPAPAGGWESLHSLRGASADLAGQLQFEDIGRQMLGHVISGLGVLREQLETVARYAGGDIDAAQLRRDLRPVDDLTAGHVMYAQVATHRAATGRTHDPGPPPPVELF